MSLRNRRVLVTGSAGVIGREVLRRLIDDDAVVLSVDREPLVDIGSQAIEHLRLDLANADLTMLADFDPHVVLHLAAAFERSRESPGFWPVNWHDNMLCSHRVVDLVSRTPSLEVFVFASSYLVYDAAQYMSADARVGAVRLPETSPKETRNVTGAAKLYTEAELDFVTEYLRPDIRTVFPRIFRAYGRGSRDVVSRWVRAALAGESVQLYNAGNQFDYVYSGDVAEGLLRMALSERARGPINLATGVARRVRDLIDAIDSAVPGFALRVQDEGNTEDFESSVADVELLQNTLGWAPGTTLGDGVAQVTEHERSQALDDR